MAAVRCQHGQEQCQGQFEVAVSVLRRAVKIDVATKAVISHIPKAAPKTFNDMEEAARAMKERDSRKESIFQQSVEAQKNAGGLAGKEISGSGPQGQRNAR